MQNVAVFPVPMNRYLPIQPTRLGLSDRVVTLQHRQNSFLLNHRRLLKTICIDTSQEVRAQVEIVKRLHLLIPVGLNVDVVIDSVVVYTQSAYANRGSLTIQRTVISHQKNEW